MVVAFSSSHVQMWELDRKEGWASKNWGFHTVMLEMTLDSPLDSKEIKPIISKGNQFWIFIGRTDAEAEAPVLWPSDTKSQPVGKDHDPGKDWRQKDKGVAEDELVGWHHRLMDTNLSQLWEIVNDREADVLQSMWNQNQSSYSWDRMSGEFVNSLVLSLHSRNLKRRTNQCYSSVLLGKTKNTIPLRSEHDWPKRWRENRPQLNFGSSFYMFFVLALSLPCVNWASQEGCLFYLRSSLESLDLLLFYLHRLFPSLYFSHCCSGLLFSYSNYLTWRMNFRSRQTLTVAS